MVIVHCELEDLNISVYILKPWYMYNPSAGLSKIRTCTAANALKLADPYFGLQKATAYQLCQGHCTFRLHCSSSTLAHLQVTFCKILTEKVFVQVPNKSTKSA